MRDYCGEAVTTGIATREWRPPRPEAFLVSHEAEVASAVCGVHNGKTVIHVQYNRRTQGAHILQISVSVFLNLPFSPTRFHYEGINESDLIT